MAADRCEVLCLNAEKAEELRHGKLDPALAGALASRAGALSDPTRLTLAHALGQADELCVCDLAWVMERAENLVSHHLRVLRQEGLAVSRREGKMAMYSLTERGRALVSAVVGNQVPV